MTIVLFQINMERRPLGSWARKLAMSVTFSSNVSHVITQTGSPDSSDIAVDTEVLRFI